MTSTENILRYFWSAMARVGCIISDKRSFCQPYPRQRYQINQWANGSPDDERRMENSDYQTTHHLRQFFLFLSSAFNNVVAGKIMAHYDRNHTSVLLFLYFCVVL